MHNTRVSLRFWSKKVNQQSVFCAKMLLIKTNIHKLSKKHQLYFRLFKDYKYLFGKKLAIVTHHEAINFIRNTEKSLAPFTVAIVHRWSIDLGAYHYTVQHRSTKHIQHESKNHPLRLTSCTVLSEAWQRIHINYYGPFLGKCYGRVVAHSFPEGPEFSLTT